MKQLVFTASWLAALLPALAAPVGPALDRPAVHSAQAARAVLLGAALAGTRIVAVGERGIVLWSDDGGARWQQAQVPTSVTLTAVRFADPRTGWATGHGGTVLGTQDGGQSWQRLLDGHAVAKALLADAQTRADAKALANAEGNSRRRGGAATGESRSRISTACRAVDLI